MQKKGANISLKGYDDIFSTDQSRAEAQQERVQDIPLSELHPFEGHPFRVVDDEEMMKTAESVRDFGVLTPAIVRPDPYGGYEIISGHRRHRASELAGKETMPVIVRDLDDDAAIILMVDANLQRETILPSERAFAFKMKLDAIRHQGKSTSVQVAPKLSTEVIGEAAGMSKDSFSYFRRNGGNALAGIPEKLERASEQLTNLYNQQEATKGELGKPFPQEAELMAKSQRLAELDAALNMEDTVESRAEKKSTERPSVLADLKSKAEHIPPAKRSEAHEEVL